MMRLPEYLYAAMSGAFLTLSAGFIVRDDLWWAVIAGAGFLCALWLIQLRPTNVSDGVIVRVASWKVSEFVGNRDVKWCGNTHLHDMHKWAYPELVCLGHECRCPESHMQRIGHE